MKTECDARRPARGWPRPAWAAGALEIAERVAQGLRNPANIGNLRLLANKDDRERFARKWRKI